MESPAGVAAHLILGPREEPFLSAMLASIAGAAQILIVNDNAPEPSPHAQTLAASAFGREGRIVVDRTPFTTFRAGAQYLSAPARADKAGDWVAFVDADEVHGPQVGSIARRLGSVPARYDFVDGYTWHFFGSFDYYTSIERRMMFFRFKPGLRWEGAVHEQLIGLTGRRVALPYVYAHYGHTLAPRRHAEKGRLYSSLGAPGEVLREAELDGFDVVRYFRPVYPRLLRFGPITRRRRVRPGSPTPRIAPKITSLPGRSFAGSPLVTKARNLYADVIMRYGGGARFFESLSRRLVGVIGGTT